MRKEDYYKSVDYDCGCSINCDRKTGKMEITNVCEEHDPTIYHEDWEE